jgi:hypothetical protein
MRLGGGELGTGGCTVPTAEREGDVDLWVFRVESGVWGWIDADVMGLGFAGLSCCPRFAQKFGGQWKSGMDRVWGM